MTAAAAAVAGTLAGGWAPAARAQGPGAPDVAEIRFVGNETFDDAVLRRAIATRETHCRSLITRPLCILGVEAGVERAHFEPREFEADRVRLQLFYYKQGYREAVVDTASSRTDDRVRLTFRIEEGEPVVVDSLTVLDDEDVVDPGVAGSLPLRRGRPFDLFDFESSRDTLLSVLRDRGYAHAEVLTGYSIPASAPRSARVSFTVIPGPRARFGEITVSGNARVSSTVIRRMLPFGPGDVYSDEAILEGRRSLFGLEIFRHAAVQPRFDAEPDTIVPVDVQVNEGQVHRVRAGAGMSTADCVSAETRWTSRNFYGGARRLQIRGRVSNVLADDLGGTLCTETGSGVFSRLNWLVSAEFSQPWFFSSRNSLSATLFAERQSLPDIFVRRAFGANLAVTRSLGRRTNATLSYRPQIAELLAAEVFFCTSFLVCQPGDIDELQAPNWLAPLGVQLARDRTDDPLSPSRGYTALLGLEHASALTGSDFEYNRAIAEVTGYWEIDDGWVLAGKVRPGWVEPRPFGGLSEEAGDISVVHPQKRFYAGGASSVRGFAQSQLGPRVLTTRVERLVAPDGDAPVCAPEEVNALSCDAGPLGDGAFDARPIGGSTALEGTVELRVPLGGGTFRGAAFLDYGQVWMDASSVDVSRLQLSPGVGIRYSTPVGPVRVDLAYRPRGIEHLQVVTSKLRAFDPARDSEGEIVVERGGTAWVVSDELALLDSRVAFGSTDDSFFQRLQLHFSIGEAF